MPDPVDQAGTDTQLRERIDELATQLLLDGAGAGLATALAQLSQLAGGRGCAETARIASELAEKTRAGETGGAAAFEAALCEGIAQLRKVLETEAGAAASPPAPAAAPPAPVVANSLAEDPELISDFIFESREHLASIESRMLVLEQNPADTEAIHSAFRGFHTIKGLAGFLELPVIQEVAHDVETVLDLARDGKLSITPAVVDVVLESADYLKQAIQAVEARLTGNTPKPAADPRGLLSRVHGLTAEDAGKSEYQPAAARARSRPATAPAVAQPDSLPVAAEPAPEAAAKEAPGGTAPGKAADTFSVRVETGKLDYLMDMVGEMVIAQSLIRHNPNLASIQDPRLQGNLSQLARITGEVQRTTMSMRMLPIGQLFQRTARLVRDLARKHGKTVELETSGEDTELDKTIAEELSDPLMHMVRNALDHGIETAEDRAAAGKNPTAHVRLAAYHQGGQIVVEISDDGRGLDREKILRKARQNGLIQEGAQLSDKEIFHLIFEPGFSTAEKITDISGRGVGMDVVRKHVQKLRGRIEIQSEAGQGSTFFIKLPLTLAIIEGLVVVVGASRYIIPIFAVKEMFRPTPELLSTIQGRDEMALVRDRLVPVVRLYRRFGVQPRSEDPCQGLLVVAESQGKVFCVLVDDLVGKQEVVIKSLGESLKNIAGIAGGAILGDGRVGLILDMDGVYRGSRRG
jgi:two-component system chemotaxis sensor kinase CheA